MVPVYYYSQSSKDFSITGDSTQGCQDNIQYDIIHPIKISQEYQCEYDGKNNLSMKIHKLYYYRKNKNITKTK